MKKLIIISTASLFIVFFSNSIYGQTYTDSINSSMTLELKNDTLFSNTGLKFFIGQKLIIGNAAGNTGQYRSIVSKKAAIVPSIWGQDKRFENAIENYVDSKKNKEKLKKSLIPGNLLTIKRIVLSKTAKPHFYFVSLASDSDGYNCDIKLALMLKELLLQPQLLKLDDQLGKIVKLRGRAISLNGYWWFTYHRTDIYVENMENLPNWTVNNHFRPIEITGILDQAVLPRIDQIMLKTNRDNKLYYIIRKASWTPISEELLAPEDKQEAEQEEN